MLGDGGTMVRTNWVSESDSTEPLPQAPGNAGFPIPRAVVVLEAHALKMWRSHSVTDQTGRRAEGIYQTTNEQRIKNFFLFFLIDVK